MFSEPTDLLLLPALLIIAFFAWGSFASFETLGWWAGWFGDKIYHDNIPGDGAVRTVRPGARSYVLFLSGIGRVSGHTLSFREQEFMRLLADMAPESVIIDDIFPYSVNNLALTGQPFFAGLWRWSLNRKRHGPALAGYLINVRNLYQVGIAADKRYGPLYNQAMAEVVLDTLLRYQYDPDSTTPIYIVGYSGSAQMGVGAITYLRDWVKAPIYFISLGGIFSSDPGLLAADHVYHLWGTHDKAQLWRLLMIGRWPIAAWSEWNRALRHGRVTIQRMAGMGHTGRGGYIDTKTTGADGRSYAEETAQAIVDIIEEHTPVVDLWDAQVWSDPASVTG